MLLLHFPVAFGKNCTQTIYLCTKSQTPVFCLKSGDVPGFVFGFFPENQKGCWVQSWSSCYSLPGNANKLMSLCCSCHHNYIIILYLCLWTILYNVCDVAIFISFIVFEFACVC